MTAPVLRIGLIIVVAIVGFGAASLVLHSRQQPRCRTCIYKARLHQHELVDETGNPLLFATREEARRYALDYAASCKHDGGAIDCSP